VDHRKRVDLHVGRELGVGVDIRVWVDHASKSAKIPFPKENRELN
jgi:hypothetical protein